MLEKCAFILEQIMRGRADFSLLAVAADAYAEQHAAGRNRASLAGLSAD